MFHLCAHTALEVILIRCWYKVCGDTVEIQEILKFGSTVPRLLKVIPAMIAIIMIAIHHHLCQDLSSVLTNNSGIAFPHSPLWDLRLLRHRCRLFRSPPHLHCLAHQLIGKSRTKLFPIQPKC